MADRPSDNFKAADLPIALYLNQRVTFDLLAVLEDGFTQMGTFQTSSSKVDTTELGAGAQLGIGNPFALLDFTLGGRGKRGATTQSDEVMTEQLVHTPTSLFARLRHHLIEHDLVKVVDRDSFNFGELYPGNFIEFEGIIRRSPLIATLEGFMALSPIMEAMDGPEATTGSLGPGRDKRSGNRKKAVKPQEPSVHPVIKQIQLMLDAVTSAGSEDFIAECGERRFVLTAEKPYFVDRTMNDVIDGTFRIFGKVTRVVSEESGEGISLLRKSPMGILPRNDLEEAFAAIPQIGSTGQGVQTQIEPPTLQIIPICIFA